MKRKEALAAVAAVGMAATYDADAAEYRVTYRADVMRCKERREAVAYYTNDGADAVRTARAMREHYDPATAC